MDGASCDYNEDGNLIVRRLQPDDEWATTPEAAALICIDVDTIYFKNRNLRRAVRYKSRSLHGRSGRGVGLLWNREDLLHLMKIRRECSIGCEQAARVMIAQREGRI